MPGTVPAAGTRLQSQTAHCPGVLHEGQGSTPWPLPRALAVCSADVAGGYLCATSVLIPDKAEHPFIMLLGTRSPAFTKHLFESFALFIGLSFSSFDMFWTLCICCRYMTRIFYPW